MNKTNLKLFLVFLLLFSLLSNQNFLKAETKPLSLWHDTEIKKEITEFVTDVSDAKSEDYVPVEKRHAVFDLDGTLLCEKPMYALGLISIAYLQEAAKLDTTLRTKQPYKAALEKDMKYLWHHPDQFMAYPFRQHSQNDYRNWVLNYLKTHEHPQFNLRYIDTFFAPMLELIDFLHEHKFEVWICSGSAQGFIRSFSENYLNIPSKNVIGSQIELEFVKNDSGVEFIRKDKFSWNNNDNAKPVKIQRQTGIKPIFAFGNSMGDFAMLQLVDSNNLPHNVFVLNHNDPAREYEYYHEKLLDECKKHGWSVVNMKENFIKIFIKKE